MSFYNCTLRVVKSGLFKHFLNLTKQESREIKRWVKPTLLELQRRKEKMGPEEPKPRSTFLEWNYDAEIYAFGKRLNENFQETILRTALRHKSYSPTETEMENNAELINEGNEIISNYLHEVFSNKYPDMVANAILNYLTNTTMLAHVASHVGLKDIILTQEYPVENITLANTFKAVVAALKQSQNLNRAHLFINDFLVVQLTGKDIFDLWEPENPYQQLENELKNKGMPQIEARLCNTAGKNTILSVYRVGLYCDKKLIGIGWGESINIAKDTAATNALQKLYNLNI